MWGPSAHKAGCSAAAGRGMEQQAGGKEEAGETAWRMSGWSSSPGTQASSTRSKSSQSVTITASGKLACARHTAGDSSML